jgi:thiol-disulfide isomerase/thioredoxin
VSQSPTNTSSPAQQAAYEAGWSEFKHLITEGGSFSGFERHCCFLNTADNRFADVSAVSGLDFLDDGRGVAVVDWDHDGDLDLWITNRTAPSIRFLRNDLGSRQSSLALRLVGRSCNRDAIGARVELKLAGDTPRKLVKVVRAGEGFLAQSSKWLHFGLGSHTGVQQVVVHWPGGNPETFAGLKRNQRYELVQGSGKSRPLDVTRRVNLATTAPSLPKSSDVGRVVTFKKMAPSFAIADYLDKTDRAKALSDLPSGPVLVLLWATWCRPCLEELAELAKHESALRAAGIEVLALNVDGLDPEQPKSTALPNEVLEQIRFPFTRGRITNRHLDAIDTLQKQIVDKPGQFALPTSFLLDSERHVVVMYRGGVSFDRLSKDIMLTTADADPRQQAAVPFAGRWMGPLDLTGDDSFGLGGLLTALASNPLKLGVTLALLFTLAAFFIRSRRRTRTAEGQPAPPSNSDAPT